MYLIKASFIFALLALLVSGCTTHGKISNVKSNGHTADGYGIRNIPTDSQRSNDVTIALAFSGGGTRAAALSYGVLKALRDTVIPIDNEPRRLLDEVDVISSVSGGSFTAAYFGLHGDDIFHDFEGKFLRRNVTGELVYGLFNPLLWFSSRGRTEMAVDYYEQSIFGGATFSDLQKQNGPLIVINATDLGSGMRFSFLQEYFDLLCSDLSSYPISSAVTASSAVPILFNPVVVKNYSGCTPALETWIESMAPQLTLSNRLTTTIDNLKTYKLKQQRPYIHLVDGGVTDNLGLLALYEIIEIGGGAQSFLSTLGVKPAKNMIFISVNASTVPQYNIEKSNVIPPIESTLNAVSDIQLHRYNDATLQLFKDSIKRWSDDVSTKDHKVTPYFIELDFKSIQRKDRRLFFNQIPSSLSLTQDQIDNLIKIGHELLLNNPEFKKFLDISSTN